MGISIDAIFAAQVNSLQTTYNILISSNVDYHALNLKVTTDAPALFPILSGTTFMGGD